MSKKKTKEKELDLPNLEVSKKKFDNLLMAMSNQKPKQNKNKKKEK